MANPDGYPREVHVKLDNGTGTITYRENSTTYLLDWEYEINENYPKKVVVIIDNADPTTTVNLLNASCAQWSAGTVALQLGDKLRLGLYQADHSTVDVLADCIITDIRPMGDGIIAVEARDPSRRLDYERRSFTHGANYRDLIVKDVAVTDGRRHIAGVTDANIVTPLAKVQFAHTDVRTTMGDGNNQAAVALDAEDEYVAQAFTAEGDAVVGCTWWYNGTDMETAPANDDGTVLVSLCADNDNSPGAVLASVQENIPNGPLAYTEIDTDFVTSNEGVPVIRGKKYWIKIMVDFAVGGTAPNLFIEPETDNSGVYAIDKYMYNTGGGETFVAGENLNLNVDQAVYEDISVEKYLFVDADDKVYLDDATKITAADSYYSFYRGRVSYYYGTVTKEQICERLITANTGLLKDLSTHLDRTFGVYSTRGKSLGDCMREVMDVFEDLGTWDGYQAVMAHYLDGSSINRLKVCKRKKTSDSATYILSHPDDTANDDEHIIMAEPRLKKTNRLKYARVVVVGKDYGDEPLVCTRSDQSKSGSFWNQMSGLAETLVVTDENLRSLDEVDKHAYALLDAVSRDVWEGAIQLSGQHEDLFVWSTASSSYGSGNIVTVNWSPLGISATKFKVTGMVLSPLTTEIYVNNTDSLLKNKLTEGWGRAERSEAFIAPVGTPSAVYGSNLTGTTITTAVLYMELCDSGGNALPGQERALCTKFASTDYNLNVYHAEFIAGDGYSSTIGGVGQIKLYAAKTGGGFVHVSDLHRTVSSIVIDEEVDKFKTGKLIFELLADAS